MVDLAIEYANMTNLTKVIKIDSNERNRRHEKSREIAYFVIHPFEIHKKYYLMLITKFRKVLQYYIKIDRMPLCK